MWARLQHWARSLRRDALALYLAARDPRVPWGAKLVAGAVAAYAISPIDLIPDFIPVVGLLDDLILVPLGIALAIRLIPPPLMAEHRAAAAILSAQPVSRTAATAIVVTWLLVALAALWWLARWIAHA